MDKPLIFITNDDGITAPGIRALIAVMKKIGKVLVVAPDKPQSGKGHAITMDIPLRLTKYKEDGEHQEYSCNGTPVDSVKLGLTLCKEKKPDIIVSGINHGANNSINIIHSGTMAAAIEGALEGIPSIGFSMTDYAYDIDFSPVEEYVEKIVKETLKNGLPNTIALNVNMPTVNGSKLKGIKICRQAHAMWNEQFEMRKDPHNREYYWLSGTFNNLDDKEDTDQWALENNFISIVPVHVDMTAHHLIDEIKNWKFDA